MLTALLVAACLAPAAPEWVEISQRNYRKPARPHAYPHRDDELLRPTSYPKEGTRLQHDYSEELYLAPHHRDPDRYTPNLHEDETRRFEIPKGDRRIYFNHSLSEHTWNQSKYPGPSDVKFVDDHPAKVRPNITPEFSLEIYQPVAEKPVLMTKNKLGDQERVSATIERVPSKGSVKRVQLSNTPVKSPTVTNAVSSIRRNDIKQYGSTEMNSGSSDEYKIKSDVLNNDKPNDVMQVFGGSKETSVRNNDKRTTSTVSSATQKPSTPLHKHTQTQHIHRYKENENNNNEKYETKIKNKSGHEENRDSIQTKIKSVDTTSPGNIHSNVDKSDENLPDFGTNTVKNNKVNKENVENPDNSSTKENFNQNRHSSDSNSTKDEKRNEDIKVNTLENVMKFMKVVADTISKNTKRGVNGKVKYLNELKETLLNSIIFRLSAEERIDATWPDDTTSPNRRRSRSATAAARGHVEFPSSESALMTISFLTFAVFLIKLVLQVIQTYKNKTMMVAPLVVATAGRAVKKLRDLS